MKKTIITIILLAISIAAASAKTTMDLDSIFANTLAFQARLDTAVYIANPVYCPINNDPHIGNTYKMYRDAIKCYTMIKNHTMKKKLIPEVLKCTAEYYEPYFASLLKDTIQEVHYYKPIHIKTYQIIDSYDMVIDGERSHYTLEIPQYEVKDHDNLTSGHWYGIKAVRPDGTKFISSELIWYRTNLYTRDY